MKTIEEFYKEIADSKELQEELKEASNEMLEAFLKKHGCDASAKEFKALVMTQGEGEIDDGAAGSVVGGTYGPPSYLTRTPIDPQAPV